MKRIREGLLVALCLAPFWVCLAQDASLSQLRGILTDGGSPSARQAPPAQGQSAAPAAAAKEERFSMAPTGSGGSVGAGLPANLALSAAQPPTGTPRPAQEAAIREVIGKGYGATREEALEDACRNAIECAVGLFVRSETLVENFELKKDEILTQSNGYIVPNGIVVMQELPATSRGYCMQIKAKVKVQEVTRTLKDIARPETAKTGGLGTLLAASDTKVDRDRRAAALLSRELEGMDPVRQLFGIRLVNEAGTTNPSLVQDEMGHPKRTADGKLIVRFLYEIYPLTEVYFDVFVPRFTQILEQISVRKPRTNFAKVTVEQETRPSKPGDYESGLTGYKEGGFSGWLIGLPHNLFSVGKEERKRGASGSNTPPGAYLFGREEEGAVLSVVTDLNASFSKVTVKDYFLAPEVAKAYADWELRYFCRRAEKGIRPPSDSTTVDYFLQVHDAQGEVLAQTQFAIPTTSIFRWSAFCSNYGFSPRIEWLPLLRCYDQTRQDRHACFHKVLRSWVDVPMAEEDIRKSASTTVGLMDWAQ